MPQLTYNAPIGPLAIAEEDGFIVSVDWGWPAQESETPLLCEARQQLEAYFERRLTQFDLPLAPMGTPFQRRVWDAIRAIPYGQVSTYGQLALALGSGPRAVGTALGRNPLPILIPCHRVLAAHGGMGGYSGGDGIDTKRALLSLEGSLT